MALPTPVNGLITDAVTQTNVAVLGVAPAQAMGNTYQTAVHSLSVMYENNTQAQKNSSITSQAAANQGVMQLYGAATMASAAAASKIADSDTPELMMALLAALAAEKK